MQRAKAVEAFSKAVKALPSQGVRGGSRDWRRVLEVKAGQYGGAPAEVLCASAGAETGEGGGKRSAEEVAAEKQRAEEEAAAAHTRAVQRAHAPAEEIAREAAALSRLAANRHESAWEVKEKVVPEVVRKAEELLSDPAQDKIKAGKWSFWDRLARE
eukprot:TRINITY_DN7233_c0_g1_i1.p2 TRINITY_DN7233_c0_g1~~TRINITY_DN7233_c0_g1_i1.p2  ORF type:complete len:157 (-),score=52.43 TRINITY_DN7233_c0_g1_i1:141-611(-)